MVRGACHHDCPDTCAWLVTVADGKVVRFEGDPHHPLTRGELCPRMSGYPDDVTFNPDRILHPLRRAGKKGEGRFERVSWDVALGEVADRLKKIVAEHGPTAVLPYSYAGTEGLVQNDALSSRFFARLGASRLERNVCGSAGYEGVAATLGTGLGMLPQDAAWSRLVVVWGANPAVTNAHGWPFVLEAKKKGARLVVIDPLRSRTAEQADWHVRPRPGTDAALALGMMHVIVRDSLHDADYVERYTLGFDRLKPRLAEYPPERVARITGLPASEVEELGRAYATTRPAAIRTLIGMEHHANGAMAFRTIACLPALTGAWRERGGGLLHLTFNLFDGVLNRPDFDVADRVEDKTIRSINMVQIGRALTDPKLDPPLRALVVYNSNPAVIAPSQNLVLEGLRREDLLTVVVEQLLTDTARFADYVFPATSQLEHLDLLTSWGQDFLSLNQPAVPPRGEAVPNSEFFRRLSRRMGFSEPYLYESDEELVKTLLRSQAPVPRGRHLRAATGAGVGAPRPARALASLREGRLPDPIGEVRVLLEEPRGAGSGSPAGPRPPPRRRPEAAACPDLPPGPPDLEVDAALQQLEPRRRAAPAEGRGRASPPDPRRGRGSRGASGTAIPCGPSTTGARCGCGRGSGTGRGRASSRCPTASGPASSREAPPGTPSPRTA